LPLALQLVLRDLVLRIVVLRPRTVLLRRLKSIPAALRRLQLDSYERCHEAAPRCNGRAASFFGDELRAGAYGESR
jgi:hypothetical protein